MQQRNKYGENFGKSWKQDTKEYLDIQEDVVAWKNENPPCQVTSIVNWNMAGNKNY